MGDAAGAVVLRRPAAMLGALSAEIAPVVDGVGKVPGARVMNGGLADLSETGDEGVRQHENEEQPHAGDDSGAGSGRPMPSSAMCEPVPHDVDSLGALDRPKITRNLHPLDH